MAWGSCGYNYPYNRLFFTRNTILITYSDVDKVCDVDLNSLIRFLNDLIISFTAFEISDLEISYYQQKQNLFLRACFYPTCP